MPIDTSEEIKEQLSSKEIEPSSFTLLVNLAMVCRVSEEHAEMAAEALKIGSIQLAGMQDRSQFLAMLNGLGTVAAVARSPILADQLRIFIRRLTTHGQYKLSIIGCMNICLVCAASRISLDDWREFVSDWLTQLAFSDLDTADGNILYSYIQYLFHAVPELWDSCSRAYAALKASNEK